MASSAQINLEDLMVVWLDDEPTSYNCWENQVRSIINYVKVFNNLHDLEQYTRNDGKDELICLIGRNQLAKEILKGRILPDQIRSTYLFGIEKQKTNHKIRGFFASMHTLLARLAEDVTAYYNWKNPLTKTFSPSTSSDGSSSLAFQMVTQCCVDEMLYLRHQLSEANEHSAAFLWWTYLIQGFTELPVKSESKHKFLNDCRQQYDGNKSELEKLADFEATYSSDKAIYWFTRDSFLYRILNKSLRTENLEYIFKLRFFIVDLHQQLYKLCSTQNIGPITVYRGQIFSRREFNSIRFGFGDLISINSFLSTSTDPEVALMYTESNSAIAGKTHDFSFFKSDKGPESMFLEIEVNNTITTRRKPFANISEYSCMQHEKEVLFSIGSLFRVISVDQLFGGKYHVKLGLVGEDDQIVKRILKLYESIVENFKPPLTLATIGKLLPLMGSGEKKEDYYRLLLEELPINHPDIENIKRFSMTYVTVIGSDLIKYLQERTVHSDQKIFHYAIQKIDNCSIQGLTEYIQKKRFEPTKYFVIVIDMKTFRDRISPTALREIFNIWKVFKKAYSQSKLYIATLPLLHACETKLFLTDVQHNIQEYNKKLCKFNRNRIIKIEHDEYLADCDDDGNIYLLQSGIDVLNQSIDDYLSKSMQQRKTYH